MSRTPALTLLTDYGPASEHVGALHAVLATEAPGIERIDLAHDLPAGDVRWAAIVLARLAPLVPGAIHLAVVDPGVGGPRRAAAVALADGGALVGPDNGLLALAAERIGATAAVAIDPGRIGGEVSATFHGRDLFAPVAARLARGDAIADLGAGFDPAELIRPDLPAPATRPRELTATVAGWDRFGNLALLASASELTAAGLRPGLEVRVTAAGRSHPAHVGRTFADVEPGSLLVHIDSHGMVAVAERDGGAAGTMGARAGARVTIAAAPGDG